MAAVLSTNLRAKVKDEYRIKLVVNLGHGGEAESTLWPNRGGWKKQAQFMYEGPGWSWSRGLLK